MTKIKYFRNGEKTTKAFSELTSDEKEEVKQVLSIEDEDEIPSDVEVTLF